jgi:hypothetical protein
MKISKLIIQLERIRWREGDIEIVNKDGSPVLTVTVEDLPRLDNERPQSKSATQ